MSESVPAGGGRPGRQAAKAEQIAVSVVWAEKQSYLHKDLLVVRGATAAEVVRQSGLLEALQLAPEQLAGIGIWGRRLDGKRLPLPEEYRVAEGDRIELYRPLPLSPMERRRLRAKRAR